MELFRFVAPGKNGKLYTNFVLTWKHKGKTYKVYCKPSFVKDMKMFIGHATKVNAYGECK